MAGLPGLGGFWLLGNLSDFPVAATIIVINAIVFRGICGVVGGILIWRGIKWGHYLTLITWLYLVVVAILTINQQYNQGLILSHSFLSENYSTFGRRFLYSALKLAAGLPIVYIVINNILNQYKQETSNT